MGVVLIKWAWLKFLRALRVRLYLQPHHSKNLRSAPACGYIRHIQTIRLYRNIPEKYDSKLINM